MCNCFQNHHLPPIREEPEQVATLALDQIEVKSHIAAITGMIHQPAIQFANSIPCTTAHSQIAVYIGWRIIR